MIYENKKCLELLSRQTNHLRGECDGLPVPCLLEASSQTPLIKNIIFALINSIDQLRISYENMQLIADSRGDHLILMRVKIGRAGRSSITGWKVLVVLVLVAVVVDAVDPTPSLETCPISDESLLNVRFRAAIKGSSRSCSERSIAGDAYRHTLPIESQDEANYLNKCRYVRVSMGFTNRTPRRRHFPFILVIENTE